MSIMPPLTDILLCFLPHCLDKNFRTWGWPGDFTKAKLSDLTRLLQPCSVDYMYHYNSLSTLPINPMWAVHSCWRGSEHAIQTWLWLSVLRCRHLRKPDSGRAHWPPHFISKEGHKTSHKKWCPSLHQGREWQRSYYQNWCQMRVETWTKQIY